MKLMTALSIATWTLLATAAAISQGSATYICVVKGSYALEDGELRISNQAQLLKNLKFNVNRQTGEMRGTAGFESKAWSTKILDYGSSEQAFKVSYVSSYGFVHVRLLQIQEFSSGRNKDFIFTDGTEVHTGACSIQ
jgi:hypothetical protein